MKFVFCKLLYKMGFYMTNYRFQQLTIQNFNYQSEVFALVALNISIFNDTVFTLIAKNSSFQDILDLCM